MSLFTRREAKKVSADSLIPQGILQQAISNPVRQLNEKTATFALILINGADIKDVASLIEKAVTIGLKHEASVKLLDGSLVSFSFGAFGSAEADDLACCLRLTSELVQELSARICGIYGQTKGAFGNVGNDSLLSFGYLIPDFDKVIRQLAATPNGEIRRYL